MKPMKLRDILAKKLTKKEMEFMTTSFDIVGDIAVIEIKPELEKKEKIIGEAILAMHKNIVTVCKRVGLHSGKFRTQKLRIIAGKRSKETVHKESGCRLKLHVEKCYFSVRSGTERLRIASMIKPKEDILVMFSGIGPFVCVIGKNCKYNSITGIELNPIAHKYAVENVEMNKIKSVKMVLGDVREVVPKMSKFDRIVMPLPRTAEEFLNTALTVAKKGTIIHLYGFLGEEEFEEHKKKIISICKDNGFKIKIKDLIKCGQFSPKVFRICVDFEVI
ncbi:class I SAM-dependent methyltransferase family protein [Candidatus Woesearchaeota archaeon]|nr:class I SAM-dependent methyltransferase family protein [Candidatus Woesearchaeota archaeon]